MIKSKQEKQLKYLIKFIKLEKEKSQIEQC